MDKELIKTNEKEEISNINQNMNLNKNITINPSVVFNCPHSQNKEKLWSLIFERKYANDSISRVFIITIIINTNDLISNIISAYKIKSKECHDFLEFSFKGKILNPSMPLNFYGLNNNSIITVEEMKAQKIVQWKNPNDLTWTLRFEIRTYENFSIDVQIDPDLLVKDAILIFQNSLSNIANFIKEYKYIFNNKALPLDLKVCQTGLLNGAKILVIPQDYLKGAGSYLDYKEINIKYISISENINDNIINLELVGLLKLCLLKEISLNLKDQDLFKFPILISYILQTLRNGRILLYSHEKTIKEIMQKLNGSNIINFSNFVDESINTEQLNKIMKSLNPNDLKIINEIKFRLSKYNGLIKLFNEEFEKAKRESIFEFSVISLVIMERQDFKKFIQEREKCPNRVDKLLFHGTSIEHISCILTGIFKKSINRCCQHGEGVYFTDFLDYCWFYGGDDNRVNMNKIPKVKDTFTLIACSTYYNKKGYRKVIDYKYNPKKNEINFAYAGAKFETLIEPDFSKFVGTEYVIWDLDQICPFMCAKLERKEFCVIWRDINFSDKPIYNNEFDAIFKKFLKERIKYINQMAKYNIYACETSKEALKLVERKKYNKIILISNVGTDLGGKKFITKARKILGNEVIVLFLAYNKEHLKWIKDFKNALFSNEPKFYEDYLECFSDNGRIEDNIKSLIYKVEKHYNIKFNFDDNFFKFPYYKEGGKYSDLRFDN